MENLIIDVVIGLLLIYIAASFLLMKVQESLDGGSCAAGCRSCFRR